MRLLVFPLLLLLALPVANAASAADIDQWLALRREQNFPFSSYVVFLKRHPDWPDKAVIQRRAEESLFPGQEDSGLLADYFTSFPPVSPMGRIAAIQAFFATGDQARAVATLRESWRQGHFDSTQQAQIMQGWGAFLTAEDHAARLDSLLWQGNLARAENALAYASEQARRIARLRLNLQRLQGDAASPAAASVASSPGGLQGGLIYDLARYYRQKNQDAQAGAMLNRYTGDKSAHAVQWWKERSLLARRALESGRHQQAYALAAAHGQTAPVEIADAEWLAGWLAVTRLNQPDKAYAHFTRMYDNVKAAISQARAAYWAGLAAAQMHQDENAAQWYSRAARHMNTFYGQMAAYALGRPQQAFADFFMRNQSPPSARVLRNDLADAARELQRRGMRDERDMFLTALLNDVKAKNQAAAVVSLANELNAPKIALRAAKAAYDTGTLITNALFPTVAVPPYHAMEQALALAIIRQESEFDRFAISPANARGLMQLMPATAAHTAQYCGIDHRDAAQLFTPQHNMILGQAYLDRMLQRYDNFIPLAVAAYNAGPGNVDKWLVALGDPRRDPQVWVDWVERIPFYETRNYVQRVWESYSLYRALAAH